MQEDQGQRGCEQKQVMISRKQLPLCCPLPNQRVWDSHPRVYMPIVETGKETCPYCGTVYVLEAKA